jgi:hypothetical protein
MIRNPGLSTPGNLRSLAVELRMNLAALAFGCYVYGFLGGEFDGGYRDLLKRTFPELNLEDQQHRRWLLEWLNKWGCRQFKKSDHDVASREIEAWNLKFAPLLFPKEKALGSLTETDFAAVESAFDDLAERTASTRRTRSADCYSVRFGPVGAAKILFALRPKALLPWDTPIYGHFGWAGSGADYREFLRGVSRCLTGIGEECVKRGFVLEELPGRVDRPNSTLVKLIDEYLWATVTNKVRIPSRDKLEEWLEWSQS